MIKRFEGEGDVEWTYLPPLPCERERLIRCEERERHYLLVQHSLKLGAVKAAWYWDGPSAERLSMTLLISFPKINLACRDNNRVVVPIIFFSILGETNFLAILSLILVLFFFLRFSPLFFRLSPAVLNSIEGSCLVALQFAVALSRTVPYATVYLWD